MHSSPVPHPPAAPGGHWSANTKLLASLLFLVLVALGIWRFSHLLQPVVMAVLLAYLLHPVITRLARVPFLNRAAAALLVYLVLLLLGLIGTLWLGNTALQQTNILLDSLPTMSTQLQNFLQNTVTSATHLVDNFAARTGLTVLSEQWARLIMPITQEGALQWDLAIITEQALNLLKPYLNQGSAFATNLARGTFQVLGTISLILILSIYIIIDIPRIEEYIGKVGPVRSIQDDLQALWRRFAQIWEGYLRGQVTIALLMSVAVTLILSVLGVRNAIALGLVAGAMEFLPVIGPVISTLLVIGVAIFQGTTAFGLPLTQYVIVVTAVMIVVNVVEGNVLVPRVIGNQLRLHPLAVFLSVLMGTSLAGILGAILAAPVAASIKLLATYTWYRVLDQPVTFLTEQEADAPPEAAPWHRIRNRIQARLAPSAAPETQALTQPEDAATAQAAPDGAGEFLYPLRFVPQFKDRVWGGRRLAQYFPQQPPGTRLAEVWLLSGHPAGMTPVAAGPLAGQTLPELIERFGLDLLGHQHQDILSHQRFPLLFKLLDVDDWLSVQVHPRNRDRAAGEAFGKTEMWVMTAVEANARLILGLREGCTRAELEAAGPTADLLDLLHYEEEIQPGQTFLVPAGLVHALGPGVSLIEIQEASDTTYRLYDWDRPPDPLHPRPLHWDEALAQVDLASPVRGPHPTVTTEWQGIESELLVACPEFQTTRIRLAAATSLQGTTSPASFEVLLIVSGQGRLTAGSDVQELGPMDCVLLPAALGAYRLETEREMELLAVRTQSLSG